VSVEQSVRLLDDVQCNLEDFPSDVRPAKEPLSNCEDARDENEEPDDEELHNEQTGHIRGCLSKPEVDGGRVSVNAGLKALPAQFLSEYVVEQVQASIDDSDT
jgi:hypothetical protein